MTTKELLEALGDGKKIAKKNWGNGAYIQMKDDQLYYYLNNIATPIKLTDLGDYGRDDEFKILLLSLLEKVFLKAILKSLKEKDKVKTITISESYISFEDDNGDDIYYLGRSDLNLKFEELEHYHEYTLEELGIYDK